MGDNSYKARYRWETARCLHKHRTLSLR